jgi:predicted ATPase/tetratricopeptide (TPR) repeat protein/DNA-binding XRE family transcriptional regulator
MDVDVSDPVAFADLLVELRVERGLSQEDLAADAKVSVRAISDLERGVTRRPHRETIRALAAALGLPGADRAAFERLARQAPPARPARRAEDQRVDVPAPSSALIGRDEDLDALLRKVREPAVRLVTVTGVGGVGKTRLAIEVAWRAAPTFPAVHLVDLSTLTAVDQVPAAIAASAGLPPSTVVTVAGLAARLSATGRRLLLLDSAEHVPGFAPDLARLLAACPELTVLATSRGPLRLQGEHLWPLPPLALPEAEFDGRPASSRAGAVDESPAVELLVERTRAVRPGFALTSANAEVLAKLCRRLDGLPLAIELAAARLRTREPAELLDELGAALSGLRTDAVDVPDRQQSLHDTVGWTVRQLRIDERSLLGVLSAFVGGAAIPLLRDVLTRSGILVEDLTGSVSVLADAHIVAPVDRGGQARLTMLDTIREVAADLLETSADTTVRAAHAACFLDLVRAAVPGMVDGELDNVRAALDWAMRGRPSLLDGPVVSAVSAFLCGRGYFAEAYRVLTAIADVTPDPMARAHAWCGAGIAANESGQPERAVPLAQRAAAAYEAVGRGVPAHCSALALLGNAYKAMGRYKDALAAHKQCLALARTLDDPRPLTVALNNLGTIAEDLGDYDGARAHYAESLAIKERAGDARGIAVAHHNLGELASELGDYATARQHLERAAEDFRARGVDHALSVCLAMHSQTYLGAGEVGRARQAAEEALRVARGVEFGHGVGLALARLGDIAAYEGDAETARRLFGRAMAQPIGLPETIRTLERFAAATVGADPEQARPLLAEATRLRAEHGLPRSPTAAPIVERVLRALAP